VSICRPHADFREQSWSLKDSEAFGPKPSTSDDLRSRYFGLRCPLRDLTCYQADLRGFPHSIGRIVRSDTVHPSQTFDLLRSHLSMTVWSAPHASPPSSRVSPPPTSHRASTPVTNQTRRLEDDTSESRCHATRLVPSSPFFTTSTAYSAQCSRVYCVPLPDMGSTVF